MAKVAGYLERRRQGFEAVVDVPPALRSAVGRKRLRKGLGTRDKDVAKARLPKALLELHARMEDARRAAPRTDPVTAEAVAIREQFAAVRAGDMDGWYVEPDRYTDEQGREVVQPREDAAEAVLADLVRERAEQIERIEGEERADYFAGLALGRVTPLMLHIETWLSEPGKRGVRRERTNMEFRGIVEAFADWLSRERQGATVERITRAVAGRYLGHMHKIGRSPKRVRDVASALSGYWQWMARRGHVPDGVNPWKGQEVGGAKHEGEWADEGARAFTDVELRKLLDSTDDTTMRDMMHVLALTGMRIGEAARLRVGGCAGGVFQVQTERRGKSPAATRAVPIHPDLAAIVERRAKGAVAEAWLFPELGEPDRYGRRSPTLDARLNRYREKIGVHDRPEGSRRSRVTVHSFRRWFITKALRAGQPERVVKQVVGHKLPKADVTLGVYYDGDTPEALRACVGAVQLPATRGADDAAPHICPAAPAAAQPATA